VRSDCTNSPVELQGNISLMANLRISLASVASIKEKHALSQINQVSVSTNGNGETLVYEWHPKYGAE
jgi:hypothetical protein